MKSEKLNEIVDSIAMYVLLFVPFVIAFIIDAMHVLILKIKGTTKSKVK